MLFRLPISRLSFWLSVVALVLPLIADEPLNSRPAKHVAAIKATTKDSFLIIDELLRNGFDSGGCNGAERNVVRRRKRVNGTQKAVVMQFERVARGSRP